MIIKMLARISAMCIVVVTLSGITYAERVGIFTNNSIAQLKFAAEEIKTALESKGYKVEINSLSKLKSNYANRKIIIALASDKKIVKQLYAAGGEIPTNLGEQAYALRTTLKGKISYWVLGGDVNGAMSTAFFR